MRLFRVLLSSISASFRYPNMMINNQLSMKSMPYSTLQGLIAAAYGSYDFKDLSFSYVFRYESIFKDIETIYKFKNEKGKITANKPTNLSKTREFYYQGDIYPSSDAFKREQLFNCYLTLYLDDEEVAKSFLSPMYQLVFGRSSDLARVVSVSEITAVRTDEMNYCGTVIPLDFKISGELYAMAKSFDYLSLPRKPIDTEIFNILDGLGKFKIHPKNKFDMYSLQNWDFKKPNVVVKQPALIDEELQTPILMRKFC
ncbi:CRISPR-associated protein Cas5 [Campylobacter curvus]|uniref:CRISPR-associated protein Cas5 n=1 Tax=Campylobacter curvus TaxID=200 RepID=UPI00147020F6|nr:CRISPR-associated protein Cas5 [Campylobacter curvus]